MVRLNRGGRGRGRPMPRPPVMPRHMPIRPMSPLGLPPFPRPPMMRGAPRGRLLRPSPPRPPHHHIGPPPPPLGVLPHPPRHFRPLSPPPPPHHPLHFPRPMPLPPLPRHMPPGPPHPPPPFPRPPLRGKFRGGLRGRGGVKRVGTTNGRAKKIQKRKEKTEGDFFCENCDRAFKTPEKLDDHNSEHEVCGRDGCTFFAHPKMIVKHIQAQHESGLFNRIVFTQSPADIAKWIAERKSRFPTKDNVERKQAQRKEMIDRGERIQTDQKPFRSSWNDRQQMWADRINNQNETRKRKAEDRIREKPQPSIPDDPDAKRGNLPRFIGTAAFKDAVECIEVSDDSQEMVVISDDEDSADCKIAAPVPVAKPAVSNILASLAADYGSDMTEDDDDDDVKVVQANVVTSLNKSEEPKASDITTIPKTNESANPIPAVEEAEDEDSGPEECAVDREDKSGVPLVNVAKEPKEITSAKSSETLTKNQPQNYYINRHYSIKRRRPTLLEKLLQNEIRHERNVILQCVRYVVKNNFLGMGPDSHQS